MIKQRVAFFHLSFRIAGGVERSTIRLANAFHARGYSVDMVVGEPFGHLLSELSEGVRVVNLKTLSIYSSVKALSSYLRRERPLVMFSTKDVVNLRAIWAKLMARTATKLIVRIESNVSAQFRETKNIKRQIVKRLIGPFYRLYNTKIVAVSSGVAEDFSDTFGFDRDDISVIFEPAVSEDITKLASSPLEHPFIECESSPIILSAGRLSPEKDFSTLLYAFAECYNSLDSRLIILGDGSERSLLEEIANRIGISHVVFMPGHVSNPYNYMKAADLFVLSSRWEGLSIALIEAMALGTPVVSTDCPSGPREVLENGRWGRLVPVGDSAALAAAMVHALGEGGPDPSARGAEFTVDRAADEYLRLAFGPPYP